jgi:hypothetical protein
LLPDSLLGNAVRRAYSHGKVLYSGQLSGLLANNFSNIEHLAQALLGVFRLTLLSASAGKERENWRV